MNFYRLSPFEWENPTPWTESDEIEYDCTLHNCFWHNWGSLMQQGSDICPRYFLPPDKMKMTNSFAPDHNVSFLPKNI